MPTTIITNAAQFQAIGLSEVCEFGNDIDLTGFPWVPLGTGTGALRWGGSLNGKGFRVIGLTLNNPTSDYQGLFGSTVGATITNIADISGMVTGKDNVGPLIGRNYTSTVTLCKCSATASGANQVGGMIGNTVASAIVSDSYATGSATASGSYAAGLIGLHQVSSSAVNCYAAGNATTTLNYAGGFAGTNQNSATIVGCFSSGTSNAGTNIFGPFVARDYTASVNGSYLTATQAKNYKWYAAAGWDFSTVWVMPITMPNLVGLDLDSAGAALCAVGCTIGTVTSTYHATTPAGQIISQSIAAGGTANYPQLQAHGLPASPKTGDVVNVTVSLGSSVEVPNTLGLTQAAAETLLSESYFTATVSTAYSSTVAAGIVSAQSPAGGTTATYQSAVAITVSLGQQQSTVPDVVGLTQVAAESAITGVSLVSSATTANSNTVAIGKVISQDPAAASTVDTGSTVDIVVSLGTLVPNVVNDYYMAARDLIEAQSLVYASTTANSNTVTPGYIISQTPAAGASIAPGSTITVTISLGAATGPLLFDMYQVREALANNSAFRTFCGVSTVANARNRIGYYAVDTTSLPAAFVATGNAWERRCDTVDQTYVQDPEISVTFVDDVSKASTDAAVFSAIAGSVDAILQELESQTTWRIRSWAPDSESTPARSAPQSSTQMVTFTVILQSNEHV